jgi:ADP-heptose:LPS heptosyltransferase
MGEKNDKHIAVLRFSALGDVAIAAPLLKAYAISNPGVKFTMVSRAMLRPLFGGVQNISFFALMPEGRHKGVAGLYRLYKDLRRIGVTDVADIHSVLRTHILRFFFFFTAVEFKSIDKGRSQKARLTARENKLLVRLPSSMSRYEQVFHKVGLEFLDFSNRPVVALSSKKLVKDNLTGKPVEGQIKIGIAPFAKHKGKEWPAEKMESLVSLLSRNLHYKIILFGGGAKESAILKGWEQRYSGVRSVAGQYGFEHELELISQLDLMVCMDSANMHFASALQIPVISVWGATHPYLGFYGWGQDPSNALMAPAECRPCSVFGNKECYRGDYVCLNGLQPEDVAARITNFFEPGL